MIIKHVSGPNYLDTTAGSDRRNVSQSRGVVAHHRSVAFSSEHNNTQNEDVYGNLNVDSTQ